MKLVCVFTLCSIAFVGCQQHRRIANYSDPYAQAFWNRNLKSMSMMCGNDFRVCRYVKFDTMGNIIYDSMRSHKELRQYNNRHYPTRILTNGETSKNLYITYEYLNDKVIQTWNELGNLNWEVDTTLLTPLTKYVVQIDLDKRGKVLRETNQHDGNYTLYYYNELGLLSSKQRLALTDGRFFKNGQLLEKWEYYYNGKNIIKMNHFWRDKLLDQYFFSRTGLPDSVLEGWKVKYVYEYYTGQ